MLLNTIVVTEFMTNCFIVADESTMDGNRYRSRGRREKNRAGGGEDGCWNVVAAVNTHAHVDHIGALKDIKDAFSSDLMLHEAELPDSESRIENGQAFRDQH